MVNKTHIEDDLSPDSPEARHLKDGNNQDDNDIKLPPVRANKGTKTTAANRKPANNKLLSASTKLVQDKLPLGSLEARSLEDSSGQDENDIRLPLVKACKRPRTVDADRKPANSKLLSVLTKFAFRLRQDIRAKKVLTLKTS